MQMSTWMRLWASAVKAIGNWIDRNRNKNKNKNRNKKREESKVMNSWKIMKNNIGVKAESLIKNNI